MDTAVPEMNARPPAPARRQTIAIAVCVAAGLLALVEFELRRRARAAARAELAAFPELAERVAARLWQGSPPIEVMLGPVENAPAPIVRGEGADRRVTWTTWGAFPDDALPGPLPPPLAGTLRVALLGHATATDDTPRELQRLLDASLVNGGAPRFDVVAAGLSSTDLFVTRLLAPRLLARVDADIVVVMHGSNDVLRARSRLSALRSRAAGFDLGPFAPGEDAGLLSLLRNQLLGPRASRDPSVSATLHNPYSGAEESLWALSRLIRRRGETFAVASYVVPDLTRVDDTTRRRWDLELRHNYAASGGLDTYVHWLNAYDRQLVSFARTSGTALIDVRRALEDADADDLWDPPHPTPLGATRIATALASGLLELAKSLPSPARPSPLAAAPRPPKPLGIDGCDDSTCPAGACRVDRVCVDRATTRATVQAECIAAGSCANVPGAPPLAPAITPTIDDARELCGFTGSRPATSAELVAVSKSKVFTLDPDIFEWFVDGDADGLIDLARPGVMRRPDEGTPETRIRKRAVRCVSATIGSPG